MKIFRIIFLAGFSFSLFSCASLTVNDRYFLENDGAPISLEQIQQNINGDFSDKIYIKTNTQTFGFEYEFCLSGGKIFYKKIGTDKSAWELYLGTGLPFFKNETEPVKNIVEINADADCLYAFSDEGILYRSYLKDITSYTQFEWVDYFGWPRKIPLYQTDLLENKKAWCVGSSRLDVEYYEDYLGNEHNYGPLGVESITFLCGDGQTIHYSDPACPSEFSHSFKGPENNHFVAENISESASTIFLINNLGQMYTRLVDYNTVGSDPMLYRYSYKEEYSDLAGSNKKSNTTTWMLPNEQWFRQPQLPDGCHPSKYITVIQNGKGNSARELRVAALNENNVPGFYSKQLYENDWKFIEAPLEIAKTDLLTFEEKIPEEINQFYTGGLWHNGQKKNISCKVDDFCFSEGPCTLSLTSENGNQFDVQFYYSEIWTPFLRKNPGLEQEPIRYFGTAVFDEKNLSDFDDKDVKLIFTGTNQEIHKFYMEAYKDYLKVTLSDKKEDWTFYLTDDGNIKYSAQIDYTLNRTVPLLMQDLEQKQSETALKLSKHKKNTTATLKTGVYAGIGVTKVLFVDKMSQKVGIITDYTDDITKYNKSYYKNCYALQKYYSKYCDFNAPDFFTAIDIVPETNYELSDFNSIAFASSDSTVPAVVLFQNGVSYLFDFDCTVKELCECMENYKTTGLFEVNIKYRKLNDKEKSPAKTKVKLSWNGEKVEIR